MASNSHGDQRTTTPMGLMGRKGITRSELMARALALGLSGSAAAALLAACGGGSSVAPEAPAATGSGESVQTETGTGAGGPKRGGIARLAITDFLASEKLDPALTLTTNDIFYVAQIFENLVRCDDNWMPLPALATAWESNDTASEWTFSLRQGVTFHDGSPLSAADVVFSLQRVLDVDLGSGIYARLSESVDPEGIEAVDDATVRLRLKRPDALMPVALAQRQAKIVKNGTTDFTLGTAIGTGPFKLTEWTAGQSWAVARHDGYWDQALPYLDGAEAVIVPDPSTKLQGVLSGQYDIGDAISLTAVSQVESSDTSKIVLVADRSWWVFGMDQTKAPFDDPRVVKAIKLAQDRDALLQTAFLGQGTLTADTPAPEGSPWYPTTVSTAQDIEGAKRLLAEAGYPDGITIELTTSQAGAGMLEIAQAFQQVVKPAGINVELNQLAPEAYWEKGWGVAPMFQDYINHRHPIDMVTLFYGIDAPFNVVHQNTPELDQLASDALAATDEAEMQELVRSALEIASDVGGWAGPLFSSSAWVVAKNVDGLELDRQDFGFLRSVSID